MRQPQGGRSALSQISALTLSEDNMKELACLSVVFLGLSGQPAKTFVPTVSVAAATAAAQPLVDLNLDLTKPLASCLDGRCGIRRTQATIKAGATTTKVRTRTTSRLRLFRTRILRRR